MCGIVGILGHFDQSTLESSIESMTYTLHHRGPDGTGTFFDAEAGVALGHRRLAILDLTSRGAQPMHSACGRYTIIFNGEIYNHLALRAELQQSRIAPWRSTSDTETLLAAFVEWGIPKTLNKSVGMFAIALWDSVERRLFLARDRYGEKPLYYGFIGQGSQTVFLFGSELKSLLAYESFQPLIDRGALSLFLQFSYVPAPYSIFENVYKLEPGTVLSIGSDAIGARNFRLDTYWSYEDVATNARSNPFASENDALMAIENVLRKAVSLQLNADVPVGAFLSGGIDSSLVAALMQAESLRKIKTFTIGFDEFDYDESQHAKAVANYLGTDHYEIRVTPQEMRDVIPNLGSIYDEPFGDSSQIPTHIVCRAARNHVTVALSGDGGDEMFGGYNRYVLGPKLWNMLSKGPVFARRIIGSGLSSTPDWAWKMLSLTPGLGNRIAPFRGKAYKIGDAYGSMTCVDDLYRALIAEWTASGSPALNAPNLVTRSSHNFPKFLADEPASAMMLLDGMTYLSDDILTKVDRAAMSVGLEVRVPMLDHRVAEIAWRLPISMKIRDDRGKWALRKILYRYAPPELFERRKAGFASPIAKWLRDPLRDWAETLLSESDLRADGYIDARYARNLWRQHLLETHDWSGRLWNILMFQAWKSAIPQKFSCAKPF